MRIGELATRAGITPSRVRFYEAKGLLPPPARRESGYRDYDEAALDVLSLISRGRRLGYTLREVASYLSVPQEAARRSMLGGCVRGKLVEIDAALAEAKRRCSSLRDLQQKLQTTS
jgi:MerR family copper efflux transcriptional regulator